HTRSKRDWSSGVCSSDLSVPCCIDTVWRVDVTNNDPNRPFIYNGNTTLVGFGTSPGSNTATQWFVIKNDYPGIHSYPTNGQTIRSEERRVGKESKYRM